MLDIGLMRYLSGMPNDIEYAKSDLLAIYRGVMAEQFVGQEMLVAQQGSLYFFFLLRTRSVAKHWSFPIVGMQIFQSKRSPFCRFSAFLLQQDVSNRETDLSWQR